MIGQKTLIEKLSKHLPKNVILVGPKLAGKKTLINEIAESKDICVLSIEDNVNAIREIYEYDYSNVLYLLADIDSWSKNSLNAILKLLEENESSYFCLTCKNIQNLPNTIVSRCQVFYMEPYSKEEIGNEYCINIGQANLFSQELLNFVDKVIDNIDTTPIANVFKLEQSINVADNKGFDFELFFQVMQSRLLSRIIQAPSSESLDKLNKYIIVTTKYNLEITVKSVNKQKLLWCWVLDMRGDTCGWKDFQ